LVNDLSKTLQSKLDSHPINEERRKIGKSPANCILLRGCGSRINVPTFQERYGMKGFMIAPTCIIAGLGMTIGLDLVKVPGATGDYHTNFEAKGKAAIEKLKEGYDFAFVHIKAVDDSGHDKRMDLKIAFLEKIDTMLRNILPSLIEMSCKETCVICVTGDHSTPVNYGDHSHEPVPVLVTTYKNGELVKNNINASSGFGETLCADGDLGRFPGTRLMNLLKSLVQ
jgi:2,3-diphosphopglycerate-independent phosphoglycerate mutase